MLANRVKSIFASLFALSIATLTGSPSVSAQGVTPQAVVFKVKSSNEQMELIVNSSRILELEQRVPRIQVGNKDLVDVTPLSDRQIQIYAKHIGVTQINLWDEKGRTYSINLVITGDARQLALLLQSQFPTSSISVVPASTSVILGGFVDRPDHISRVQRIAEDFYPKVINNITVGGSQQVLLHVKVMEVSRTKLRDLGFDFADVSSGGDFVLSGVSGLLSNATATTVTSTGAENFAFGIVDGGNSFFGLLSALQRSQIMKVLAEPTLTTVSGRPAYFVSGGEIPILIPQSLGTVSIEFHRFGTQVDFVPIVLGNGNVRLDVRPSVSEIDTTISVTLNGSTIPGFRKREVDTSVELRVGQTLAIAGLIQMREDAQKDGLPWISDMSFVGMPFRRMRSKKEEIELLIMVRPELAEGMECEEVPPGGPGLNSDTSTDCDLYIRGHLEVPKREQGLMGPPPGAMHRSNQPHVAPESIPAARANGSQSRSRQAQSTPVKQYSLYQPGSNSSPPATAQQAGATRPIPYNPPARQARKTSRPANTNSKQPDFIGPVGYDVGN